MTSTPDASDGTSSNQNYPFLKSKGAIAFFAVALLLVTLLVLGAIQRFVSHRRRRALLWLRGGPGFAQGSGMLEWTPPLEDVGPIPKLYDAYASGTSGGDWKDIVMPLSVEVLRAGEHVEPEGESGAQTPAEHRRRLPDSLLESVMHGFMSRLRYPGRRAQIPQPIPTPPACLPLLEDPSESPPLARVRIAAAIAMPTQSHESILPLYALGVAEVGLCGGTTYFS